MFSRMKKKLRAWNPSIKKLEGNPSIQISSTYLKFEGSEENFISNGAGVVEESISLFHGKANPIRHFSVNELNNLSVNSTPYYSNFYDLHQGCWEGRLVTVKKVCYPYRHRASMFVREIVVAPQMATHNNAHKLLGCCLETRYPVLIYEWVQPKTLEDSIIFKEGNQSLEWKDRLRIAWEISYVVAYLHTAFPRPIIYRDLKPDNVVLDQDNTVKLCDFSACISIPEGKSFLDDERVIGTLDYMDPAYAMRGVVSEFSDVYSFGVLLLQLLTGKRADASTIDDDHYCNLVGWVQEIIEYGEILDPFIIKNGVTAIEDLQQRASIQLAFFCITKDVDSRPTMVEVATELKSMITSPESVPTITRFQLPKLFRYREPQNTEKSVNVEQELSINSANPTYVEDQVVDQVKCEEKVKKANKNEMKDKRMQRKKLVCLCSDPLQCLVGTEGYKYLPNSCKKLHNLIACQPPETSIAITLLADIFQYHDTEEEFEACFTTQDVVQFLSMQCLNSSCLQVFMRYLESKCKLLEVDSIAYMCPKRLGMVKKHLIYTSQYVQYAISESQSKSYVLAPHYHENHWTLIVVCPQKQIVLFFDPMGSNLDGLAIKRRINMALRNLQDEISQEDITWRLVQCPRQENEAETGYYVMRYMYEIVTLYHQSHVNLEESFESESYTQQQIDEVRDIWAKYFINECT